MRVVALIPARMASSRFPGKPLARIHNRSMLEYVFKAVNGASGVTDVFVATCDTEIVKEVASFGGQTILTGSHHERASDRCAEALHLLEQSNHYYDVVVMVQGDEPMTHPEQLLEVLSPFSDNSVGVVNLYSSLTIEEAVSKNAVKVVINRAGNAMYFSRQPIPGSMVSPVAPTGKQLGLIAFRTSKLKQFSLLAPTPYEVSESVDMLRFLEHGIPIRMQITRHNTMAVDTAADLEAVTLLIAPPNW